eukprot:jgi/Hompol1/585/HPOL_005360-RA
MRQSIAVAFSAETELAAALLWRAQRAAGSALHPKPRSFAAALPIPIDAQPSVVLPDYGRCFVRYVLLAELIVAGSSLTRFKAALPISVYRSPPLPQLNLPLLLPSLPKDFLSFNVSVGLSLAKSVFLVAEPIQLQVRIANADKRDIRSVRISLDQICNSLFIAEMERSDCLASQTVDTLIAAGDSRAFALSLTPSAMTPIAPSTQTACVQVAHFVHVQIIPNTMFSSSFMFKVPIEL